MCGFVCNLASLASPLSSVWFLGRCLSTWDKDREPARTQGRTRQDQNLAQGNLITAARPGRICWLYINNHNSFVGGSVKHGVVSGNQRAGEEKTPPSIKVRVGEPANSNQEVFQQTNQRGLEQVRP